MKTKSIKTHSPPFRPGTTLQELRINIVLDMGGLGDMIARSPAILYLLKHNPHIRVRLWCPEYFIELAELIYFGLHARIEILSISEYSTRCAWDEPHFSFRDSQHTSLATNLTKHAFNMLVNKEVPEHELVYPRLKDSKYSISNENIVITPNSTAPARAMPQSLFENLIEWAARKNKSIVVLGQEKTPVTSATKTKERRYIESQTLEIPNNSIHVEDLRDQTTLVQALDIISKAHCIIGYDNGLLHLAGLTGTPIINIFTSVRPEHRKIYRVPNHTNSYSGEPSSTWRFRSVVPPEDLTCRFCQSDMGYVYGHKFKYCYYDDYQCTKSITLNDIEKAYKSILTELENEESFDV